MTGGGRVHILETSGSNSAVECLPSKQVFHQPFMTVAATRFWLKAIWSLGYRRGHMVELKLDPNGNGIVAEDIWVSGMRQAGLSEQDISRVVSATAALADPSNGHGELVPVKEAARRIGRSENTVRSWIRLGHLPTVEVPPPADHANGPWVHVDMTGVEQLDRGSATEADEGELITFQEAADRFEIKLGRLQSWFRRGHLRSHGRRRGRGGGPFLIDAAEVASLIENPPRPGPQKQSREYK